MRKRKNNVPRPRNGGTWTEARYWSQIRSHLRNAFKYWKPILAAKEAARRPNQSGLTTDKGNLVKWEYQCAHCNNWFIEKKIQVDHKKPAGSLNCLEDVATFIEYLTPEDIEAYQVLCKGCHQIKTNKERVNARKRN